MSEKERVIEELQRLEADIQKARDAKDTGLSLLLTKRGRLRSQLAYCGFIERWLKGES
jgi:hypothetical protein